MKETEPYLSVVIPVYKEMHRLPKTFQEIRPYLDGKGFSYEVLIVDDRSPDGTAEFCRQQIHAWPQLKLIEQSGRIGKGAAVKKGGLGAEGRYVLIMDADHPTPIDTLDLMLPLMKDYEFVAGVRTFSGEEGASGRGRRIIGLIQQLLAHLIVFKKSVADSQCGFKLFSRLAIQRIFPRLQIKGGMYDVEVFCIAHKYNLRIYSKPVKWINKEGSTIPLLRCLIEDPISLLSIRLREMLGGYD